MWSVVVDVIEFSLQCAMLCGVWFVLLICSGGCFRRLFANPVSPSFLQFFFGVFWRFVETSSSGVIFPSGLVSFGCPCVAVGFPPCAERRVKVHRSFPVLRGFVVMWDSFSYFRSFLVC